MKMAEHLQLKLWLQVVLLISVMEVTSSPSSQAGTDKQVNEQLDSLAIDLPTQNQAAFRVIFGRMQELRQAGLSTEAEKHLRQLRDQWLSSGKIYLAYESTNLLLEYAKQDLRKGDYLFELQVLDKIKNCDLREVVLAMQSGVPEDALPVLSESLKAGLIQTVRLERKNSDSYFQEQLALQNKARFASLQGKMIELQIKIEDYAKRNGHYPKSLNDAVFKSENQDYLLKMQNSCTGKLEQPKSRSLATVCEKDLLPSGKLAPGAIEYTYVENPCGYLIRGAACDGKICRVRSNISFPFPVNKPAPSPTPPVDLKAQPDRIFAEKPTALEKKTIEEEQLKERAAQDEKEYQDLQKRTVKILTEFHELVLDLRKPLRLSLAGADEVSSRFRAEGIVLIPNKDVTAGARYFAVAIEHKKGKKYARIGFASVKSQCKSIASSSVFKSTTSMPEELEFASSKDFEAPLPNNQMEMDKFVIKAVEELIDTIKKTRDSGECPWIPRFSR